MGEVQHGKAQTTEGEDMTHCSQFLRCSLQFAFQGQELVSVWEDSWLKDEGLWGPAFHFQHILLSHHLALSPLTAYGMKSVSSSW